MKIKCKYLLISLLLIQNIVFAHTLILESFDNEDGTMEVTGAFSTGARAEGAEVRIESLISGEILYKKRLPQESSLIISIPKEAYQIVLDGGPGHQVVKEGLIKPKGGFSIYSSNSKNKNVLSSTIDSTNTWSIALITLVSIAFILIFLTLYISMKNTEKLMKELKKNKQSIKI